MVQAAGERILHPARDLCREDTNITSLQYLVPTDNIQKGPTAVTPGCCTLGAPPWAPSYQSQTQVKQLTSFKQAFPRRIPHSPFITVNRRRACVETLVSSSCANKSLSSPSVHLQASITGNASKRNASRQKVMASYSVILLPVCANDFEHRAFDFSSKVG